MVGRCSLNQSFKSRLVSPMYCNRCNLQHVGETKRRLKERFNLHCQIVLRISGNMLHKTRPM